MASMTMTAASLLCGATSTLSKHPSATATATATTTTTTTTTARRGLLIFKASGQEPSLNLKNSSKEDCRNGRRDLVFAAAAAVACTVAKVAMADEPKAGTPEAKKKYAAVCVTMPTARICHK